MNESWYEIMNKENQFVWYASYGSNINYERFLCYIRGGNPPGSTRVETGCQDTSLPAAHSIFLIEYPLYFAKEAVGWKSMGVAFLGLKKETKNVTYSKKYLITVEQFLDVVKQENGGKRYDIDLNKVKSNGSQVFRQSWYGNVVYLGEDNGYPIFTFTCPWDLGEVESKKPSHEYLTTIVKGLKNDYSNEKIYDYFKNKPGIKGKYSEKELAGVIFTD